MGASHILLLQHLYDYGIMGYPPRPHHYGVAEIPEEDESIPQAWYHPSLVYGLEQGGIVEHPLVSDLGMLGDAVKEGFFLTPFMSFEDDDNETCVVSAEHLAFALVVLEET